MRTRTDRQRYVSMRRFFFFFVLFFVLFFYVGVKWCRAISVWHIYRSANRVVVVFVFVSYLKSFVFFPFFSRP